MKNMSINIGAVKKHKDGQFLAQISVNGMKAMALVVKEEWAMSSVVYLDGYWRMYEMADEDGRLVLRRLSAAINLALHEIMSRRVELGDEADRVVVEQVRYCMCAGGQEDDDEEED